MDQRGSSFNQPLLTLRFSSSAADVIRVQLFHHKGGLQRRPEFELQSPQVLVSDGKQAATLTSRRGGGKRRPLPRPLGTLVTSADPAQRMVVHLDA